MPTWLIVILVVAAIGGIIGYYNSDGQDKQKSAIEGAATAGLGCGYIILQIFLALLGLWIIFKLGSWLFG